MEWLRKNWTMLMAVVGIVSTFSIMSYRVDIVEKRVDAVEVKQVASEAVLSDIKEQLAEMNVKLQFIIDGKVKITLQEVK